MKNIFILFAITTLALQSAKAQNTFPATGAAGIGTTAPNTSSLLEIKSITKGFLPPRMTLVQRNAIATPATGLLIYQTNSTPGLYYYSGTAWMAVSSKGANTTLSNLASPTAINQSLLPGTTNSIDLGSATKLWKNAWFSGDASINNLTVGTGGGSVIFNTAIGSAALFSNSAGTSNSAIGFNTLRNNTTGYYNTATGASALAANTTGYFNTASGAASLVSNTTGYNNIANGYAALFSNTEGSDNIATGAGALHNSTTGSHNIAMGSGALYSNVTGNNLVAIGDSALFNQNNSLSSYNNNNTAVGTKALFFNSTGGSNVANGYYALYANTTGNYNTATGVYALYTNSTGINNTATGTYALYVNTTGYNNTAIGWEALTQNTSGYGNTAAGYYALGNSTRTNYNTAIGYFAGTFASDLSNTTALGNSAAVDASDKVRIGNTSVTSIGGQVGWTNFSDGRIKQNIKENVPGLAFINLLKPVTYNFSLAKEYALMGRRDSAEWKTKYDIEKINFTGFVAQDVDVAAKKISYDFSGIDKTGKIMGLRYAEFVVPLVKAVQELSNENDELKKQNADLETRMKKLEAMLNVQQSSATNNTQKATNNDAASLEQNIPNPFNNSTTIGYTLPQQYSNAKLIITDKTGKTVKEINISGSGKGSVQFDVKSLSNGTYQYNLYVDGKIAGSKQMLVAK